MAGCLGPLLRRQQRSDPQQKLGSSATSPATTPSTTGDELVLYHQTCPQHAEAILSSHIQLSKSGHGGGGIYFAPDPQATTKKANYFGVILECRVRLGRVRHVGRPGNYGRKLRQLLFGYDSVALTFLEGGVEYVVYDAARVSNIRVHSVLPTCSSNTNLGFLLSTESSSGSFQIATGVDPRCDSSCSGSSGGSSASGSSSNSSVSGGMQPYRPVFSQQQQLVVDSQLRVSGGGASTTTTTSSSSDSSVCGGSSCSSGDSVCCQEEDPCAASELAGVQEPPGRTALQEYLQAI